MQRAALRQSTRGRHTQVCDEDGLLQWDVGQRKAALHHPHPLCLARVALLLLLRGLEVGRHVGLPVPRRAEDLLAVRARERPHACGSGRQHWVEQSKGKAVKTINRLLTAHLDREMWPLR